MINRDDPTFAVEYDALVHGCGYHEWANWSVVTLTGSDRQRFLHNMCTNDIRKLAVGEGCEAFCTDVKGKIVAHVFVLLQEDQILLLAAPDQAERIIGHLDRYIVREDVQLRDDSAAQVWLVLAGSQVKSVLPVTLGSPWQNAVCPFGDIQCTAARFPLSSSVAYLLGASRGQVTELRTKFGGMGAIACEDDAWTALRVEGGLPLFGVDFDHSNLPQEVSRDAEAISFTKGCYLGQETIARLDALGHVNKQLVTLKFDPSATPTPGTQFTHDGQPAGTATSIAWSPRLGAMIGLGMVRRGGNAGTRLNSPSGPLEVIPTPAIS